MRTSTVHLSLNRPKVIMGVNGKVFGTEAGLIAIFVALQIYLFLLFIPIIHALARWAQSRDANLVEAAVKFSREKDAWDPWHHPAVVSKRPKGFGRGLPC